jgi:hypothetical protein
MTSEGALRSTREPFDGSVQMSEDVREEHSPATPALPLGGLHAIRSCSMVDWLRASNPNQRRISDVQPMLSDCRGEAQRPGCKGREHPVRCSLWLGAHIACVSTAPVLVAEHRRPLGMRSRLRDRDPSEATSGLRRDTWRPDGPRGTHCAPSRPKSSSADLAGMLQKSIARTAAVTATQSFGLSFFSRLLATVPGEYGAA